MLTASLRSAFVLTAVLSSSFLAHAQEFGIKTPHQHRTASIRHVSDDGTAYSTNWSGYAVASPNVPNSPTAPTGVTVTYVAGTWVVPTVNCKVKGGANAYAAFWVGIDGWYSNTVEQIGTDSDCSSGVPQYYAWYEFYPLDSYYACPATPPPPPGPPGPHAGPQPPPCALQNLTPGDMMSASVTYNKDKTFTATITDVTQQTACVDARKPSCSQYSFSTIYTPNRQTGPAEQSSAQWIAESPCCTNSGGELPLADFGKVLFSSAYATVNNPVTPGAAGALPVGSYGSNSTVALWTSIMVNENTPANDIPNPPLSYIMAEPSQITGLDDFNVQWYSVGP